MVEIIYGEHSEQADLAGRRVTEARHQYKPVFNIPDRAQAILNGKPVKKNLEPETILNENDKLSFAEKSRKGLVLLGALLTALVVTGGMFVYLQTTASVTLGVTRDTDFASVSANLTVPTWTVFGKYKGTIPSGNLFTIIPATGYTGDLIATVYIGNTDELVDVYRVLFMRISVYDNNDVKVVGPELLALGKGEADLPMDVGGHTPPFTVKLDGGFYVSHGFYGWSITSGYEDPLLWCNVVQR